jgi:hypothetical protein
MQQAAAAPLRALLMRWHVAGYRSLPVCRQVSQHPPPGE